MGTVLPLKWILIAPNGTALYFTKYWPFKSLCILYCSSGILEPKQSQKSCISPKFLRRKLTKTLKPFYPQSYYGVLAAIGLDIHA